MTANEITWIECNETGCPNGIGVYHRHAANFLDRFTCPEHDIEPTWLHPATKESNS